MDFEFSSNSGLCRTEEVEEFQIGFVLIGFGVEDDFTDAAEDLGGELRGAELLLLTDPALAFGEAKEEFVGFRCLEEGLGELLVHPGVAAGLEAVEVAFGRAGAGALSAALTAERVGRRFREFLLAEFVKDRDEVVL